MGASSPTWDETIAQMVHEIHLFEELDKFANANSDNFLGIQDSLTQSYEGEYVAQKVAAVGALRKSLNAMLTPEAVQRSLVPHLRELSRLFSNAPYRSAPEALREMAIYMAANSKTFEDPSFTYDTIAADGGNTGNGVINRLTVDQAGNDLVGVPLVLHEAECVSQQGQTPRFEEVLRFRGNGDNPDFLEVGDFKQEALMKSLSARASRTFLNNPTFTSWGGSTYPTASTPSTAAAVTDVSNWTLDSAADAQLTIDTTYRQLHGETAAKTTAVEFTDNNALTQVFADERNPKFDEFVPMHLEMPVYRKSSCDGTWRITLGGVTVNTTMSGLNNSAWNRVVYTIGANSWLKSWATADQPSLKIELTGRSTGSALVGEVTFAPFQLFNGLYYAPVAGATPYMLGDKFTWTPSVSARGIIVYWLLFRSRWGFDNGITVPLDSTPSTADP